jgi:pilus assembly protein CpaE
MTSKAYAATPDALDWDVGEDEERAFSAPIDDDLDSFDETDFADDALTHLHEPGDAEHAYTPAAQIAERYAPIASPELGAEHPIPRITIAAFCDRPEIASLLSSIAADRRLAKATMTVEMGGVTAGIARLSTQASPNLLILDLGGPPAALIADLDRIAEYVDAGAKALVIGAANDIGLYRELIRRGVSEYLVPPLQPVDVIRAISTLYADPEKPFVGRVAAILGARGGVGASTIAQNVAWALAERFHAATTLIDLDVSFGTAGLAFDEDADTGVGEALQKADQLDQTYLERLLVRRSEHLSLFPASAALERDLEAAPGAYEALIDQVRRLSPFVVLDLPHMWSRWMRNTVLSADDVIVVATPDLASLRNAKNLFDVIRNNRPHDSPPALILNMVGVPKRPEIPVKEFCKAVSAEPLTIVPFDPATFGMASNAGQMLLAAAPTSRPATAIDAVARALCGREPAAPRKSSVLNRLLKR